ncbi:hypothetical protein [Desulfonatronospira sp.]|nr:hypothetical protein [Desulfonatronospira sp.]
MEEEGRGKRAWGMVWKKSEGAMEGDVQGETMPEERAGFDPGLTTKRL